MPKEKRIISVAFLLRHPRPRICPPYTRGLDVVHAPAIDAEELGSHETGLIRGQEQGYIRDVFRGADTTEGR